MTDAVRPYDVIGRYGGEEFLIVLPDCNTADTMNIAERIRQCIAAEPVQHRERLIPVTISLGATVYTPPNPADIHVLLHDADVALYRAKNGGRNSVEINSPKTVTEIDYAKTA